MKANVTLRLDGDLLREARILQAATASGAQALYSEVLGHGQSYGPVSVRNPFAG